MHIESLVTTALRGLSAFSRFFLFVYLGRNADIELLGAFGVIAALCAIIVQFAGLELHYINARVLLSVPGEERGKYLYDQFYFHLLTHLVLLPWLLLVFILGYLDPGLAIYVIPLIFFEHFSQEMFRVLVTLFRPVLATLILFIRSGLWIFAFIGITALFELQITIKGVILAWLLSSFAAFIIGLFVLRGVAGKWHRFSGIDWKWLQSAVVMTFPFIINTVLFTTMQSLDRLVLNYHHGESSTGVFFFFSSMASAFYLVLSFSVGIFHGPRAIQAFKLGQLDEYQKERALIIKKYIRIGAIIIVPAIFSIYPILWIVDKAAYAEYVVVYWIMLGANILLVVSDVINFDLYVREKDRAIMFSVIVCFIAALVAQVALVPDFGVIGAAIATTFAYMLLGLSRWLLVKKLAFA